MATLTKIVLDHGDPTAGHLLLQASSVSADFLSGGRDLILLHNTNSGSTARTLAVTSVEDPYGRTKDINSGNSVPAAGWAIAGPFKGTGWRDGETGKIAMNGSNAELKADVLVLPNLFGGRPAGSPQFLAAAGVDRVVLTPVVAAGSYAYALQALSPVAADVTDFNKFLLTGKDFLLAINTAVGAETVTIYGRTADLDITAESIDAGAAKVFGSLSLSKFRQPDGYCWVDASDVGILLAVVRW